tara:strand:- start:13 stop:342 length:330 start_codon:yes stop_codon:yes gene_type:complete
MNEEAIKIAYDLFVADGYKKSIDEFKSLMQGNPKGREVAYNLFVADGYKKPINEFEVLMGVTAPSDLTTEEASLEKKRVEPLHLWIPHLYQTNISLLNKIILRVHLGIS